MGAAQAVVTALLVSAICLHFPFTDASTTSPPETTSVIVTQSTTSPPEITSVIPTQSTTSPPETTSVIVTQPTTGPPAATTINILQRQPVVSFLASRGNGPGNPTTLHEDTTAQATLAIVKCDLKVPTAVCTCNLKETLPDNGPFDVWRLTTETSFKVYFVGTARATATLDYSKVKTHIVSVVCTETQTNGDLTTGEGRLEVDILPNQQPVINSFPSATTIEYNAQSNSIPIGSTLYTVSVNDAENNAITYTMTQEPDSGFLSIGASDGIIRTAVDLRKVTTPNIICTVTVSDGKNVVTGFKVTVRFTNLNTRPVIVNLPASVNITENQQSGFILSTLTFTDTTPQTQVLEPECSVDPVAERYKFLYEVGTRRLKLNALPTGETLLDFETTDKYLITCVVNDGFLSSQDDVLTVHINNVNEPPVFNQKLYFCNLDESKAGVSTCDLGLKVTDPELDTIPTLELLAGNNSDRFRYDRINDKLTFNDNYDVDNNQMPTHTIITIFAVDVNRATSTAKIDININDANDNACDFGSQQAAQFTIDQGTLLQTLGSFVATDRDLTSPNNKVSFEVIAGFPVASLNYLTVFGNGEIKYVGLVPETEHGKSFAITVRCKDGGNPPLSSTATVQVSYLTTTSTTTSTTTTTTTTTPTTTSTTTTQAPDIWDNTAFVVLFVILMLLLALALLVALWYFCCRGGANGMDCCAPRYMERKPERPSRSPPRYVRPAPEQREPPPRDDYYRHGQSSRVSPEYRDQAWRNGDHFEDGLGYDARPLTKSDIFMTHSQRPRALPPPVGRDGFY